MKHLKQPKMENEATRRAAAPGITKIAHTQVANGSTYQATTKAKASRRTPSRWRERSASVSATRYSPSGPPPRQE